MVVCCLFVDCLIVELLNCWFGCQMVAELEEAMWQPMGIRCGCRDTTALQD